MSLLKKLAGQTALYGLSSIVGRALNFLLVPFYTTVLPAGQYGIVTKLYALAAFLNIVYLYGMETTYFRFATKENLSEKDVYNNTLSLILSSSILFSGLMILGSGLLANVFNVEGKESFFIWLALILAIDAISAIPFAKLRLEQKAGRFAAAKIFNICVNIFFNLFFLVFCRDIHAGKILQGLKPLISSFYDPSLGIEYIFISNFLASLLTLPFLWSYFIKVKFTIDKSILKSMFVYSTPLMFLGLAGMVDEMLSRLILDDILPKGFYPGRSNEDALGIFGACYKLAIFMALAIQAFRYAADPFFFSQAQDKNAPEVFAKVMKWFIIVCALIFVGVSTNLSIVELLLRKEIYREGILVVPVLLMANLFAGIYYNLSVWYKLTNRTQYAIYISVTGAIVTIILNFILIPVYGYMGSAVATLACYFIISVISYIWGQKYFPVPYNILSAMGYLIFSAALVIAALVYPFGKGTLSAYAYQFSLCIVFILTVFLLERKNLNFSKK
ncbi:MAG: oligosaccharide flippase family protein [Cytophagaceae bacterium]|nr:oligosaccharide flippase family protein [Cytophagaceae bacterium]